MDDLSLSEDDRSSRDSEKEVESDDDENRSRTGDRESDEGHTKSDDDSEQPPGSDEDGEHEDVDIKNIRLCRDHPAGAMTRDCKVCNDGIALLRPSPALLQKKLLGDGSSTAPDNALLSRYGSRFDETTATLSLSSAVIQLAKDTFSKGTVTDQKKWKDAVRDFLTLNREDHESLSEDLNPESLFNKLKKEKRFKGLFKYANDLKVSLKSLRISQRPIFKVVEVVNSGLQELRSIGESDGVEFEDTAPPRAGAGVPRHGRQLLDNLKIKSEIGPDLFRRPDLSDFIEKAGLNDALAKELADILEDQRMDAANKYLNLFEHVSEKLTIIDDMLIFYLDLYSHADGLIRELLRDKLASLFKLDIKSDVIKDSDPKALAKRKETSKGIFGGISISLLSPFSYYLKTLLFR